MIAQNLQIAESELNGLLLNPEKKKVVLKIIIQALYRLGLQKSASQLERQSEVIYLTEEVKTMREELLRQNYEEVNKIISQRSFQNLQISEILNELTCLKLIREQRIEQALQLLQNFTFSAEKKNQLAEELMFGEGTLPQPQLNKKYDFIVQKCIKKDIQENSLEKILKSYLELEKRGLTKTLPGLSLLESDKVEENLPPKSKIFKRPVKGEISFIKFNKTGTRFIAICELPDKKLFILSSVKNKEIEFEVEKQFSIQEDIEGISWLNHGVDQFSIVTYKRMVISSENLQILAEKPVRKSIRMLCCQWNTVNKLLYVGGSFESIKIFNSNLEEVMSIQPFINTRCLCFNDEGNIFFAVSATSGTLVVYNIFTEKEETKIQIADPVMFMRLRGKQMILTTQKFIYYYVVEKKNKTYNLIQRQKFTSPNNSGSIIIEAAFFNQWVICLGEQKFKACFLSQQREKQVSWFNDSSSSFDVGEGFMVSGSNEMKLWDNKMVSESESEMESENQEQILEDSQMFLEDDDDDDEEDEGS